MKKAIYQLLILLLFPLIMVSCSNEDSSTTSDQDTNPINEQPPLEASDLYKIELNAEKIDIPNDIIIENSKFTTGFDGENIYITRSVNNIKYMNSYNVNSHTTANLQIYDDTNFINGRMHYFNNDYSPMMIQYEDHIFRYSLVFQTWSKIENSSDIIAKTRYKGTGILKDKMFFIGKDTDQNNILSYNLITGQWQEYNKIWRTKDFVDMVAVNDKLYCLSIAQNGKSMFQVDYNGVASKFGSYSFEARNNNLHSMAAIEDRFIFVLTQNHQNKALYAFDTQNPGWRGIPISVNLDPYSTNIFSDNQYLYLVGKEVNGNKISVYKITVNK